MKMKLSKEKFKIAAAVMIMSTTGTITMSMSLILAGISAAFPDKSISSIQLIFTLSSLSGVIAGFLTGSMVTVMSKKKLCIFSQAATLIGAALGYFFWETYYMLFVVSFIMGFAMTNLANLETALLAENFDIQERIGFIGLQALFIHGGGAVLMPLCGVLVSSSWVNWFLALLILVPIMIVSGFLLPEGPLEKNVKGEKVKFLNPYVISKYIQIFALGIVYATYYANVSFIVREAGASTALASVLNTVYEIIVVVMGLLLTQYVKLFRKNASWFSLIFIALSMWCYTFAASGIYMVAGSVFLGVGFGTYMCLVLAELPDHVHPLATTKSVSIYVAILNIGMFVSPYCITAIASLIGEGAKARFTLAAVTLTVVVVVFKFVDDVILRKEAMSKE